MIHRPFVSVIIPTYNRAQLTTAAINSVLAQTYPQFEIILVDDGSTDGTYEALQRLTSQRSGNSEQIRYFHQQNQGQSVARNRGIAEARGEWIAFLDSDDIWFPEKLEWQVRAFQQLKNDCGACFTDARLVNNSDMDTTAFRLAGRQYEQTIGIVPDAVRPLAKSFGGSWVQTLLARADLIKQIEGFDPDIHFAEDYDFLFRLSLVTAYCYVNMPLALIDRTVVTNDPSVTCRLWDKLEFRLLNQQYMYEKWLSLGADLPRDVRKIIAHNLRSVHSAWTNWYLENGQYKKARQSVSKAAKYDLTPNLAVKWTLTQIAPAIARRITPKHKPGWDR